MTLKEFFSYTLVETKEYDIVVYEILAILLVLLIASIIIRVLKRIFRNQENNKVFDSGRSHAILQIIRYVLWITAIFISFEIINIKLTLLLAGSAALLVGLGLGLQQIFQDIMSGIAILFEGTLKIGDVVEIQDDLVGVVKEIGLRTSKIETRDSIIMIIPNSKFVSENVINWSHMDKKTRFKVEVGVAYGSDIQKVKRTLLECANSHEKVSSFPDSFVRFKDFGDSSLQFQLLFWTTHIFNVEDIKSDLRYSINAAFLENGIHIPFPQRDVHIISQEKKDQFPIDQF